jgi:hypothetical protein
MRRPSISIGGCAVLGAATAVLGAGRQAPSKARAAPPEKILFVSDRVSEGKLDIYTMNPDGSRQTRLTRTEENEFDPVRSPDGRQIAFAATPSSKEDGAEIYVMNADLRREVAGMIVRRLDR